MSEATGQQVRRGGVLGGLALGALVLGAAVFLIVSVATDFAEKVEALASAPSDNVQWTLSQVEVEYLRLDNALQTLVTEGEAAVPAVRRRFDILYSRINTLRTGQVFEGLRANPSVEPALDKLWGTIVAALPLIDGSDAGLVANAAAMERAFDTIHDEVRTIGLYGINHFAEVADNQRDSTAGVLKRVGGVALLLIVALVLGLFVLWRLFLVSERHAKDAQASGARMSAIVSTALDAVIVSDRHGRIREFNAAAEQIFGYSRDEVIGLPIGNTIVPGHLRGAHEAGMRRYDRTGEKRVIGKGRVRLEAMRKSGEVFPIELSISTALDPEGREIMVSFLRDITHRVQAEADLRAARDTARAGERAKTELLAVMSHEMRTPLNGMLGTLELLQETDLDTRQADYVDIIARSGDMLLHHVNDVLDISRHDAGDIVLRTETFDIAAAIREIVDGQKVAVRRAGNVIETAMPDPDETWLRGDPVRVRQVLYNLIGNAVKFTRDGTVSVAASWLDDGRMLEITVADTGPGIPEDERERIFEDFVTLDASYGREAAGTGLGLGITRRMVRAMNGEIGVESEPGEGSLFWVRLPLERTARPADAAPTAAPAPDPAPPATLSVLVVEDNEVNRLVIGEMLQKEGHHVVEAVDGAEGVEKAAAQRFDLILMDISMPRLDGVGATERIRAGNGLSARAPIFAVTAHAMREEIDRFHAVGMNATLTKPISRAALRDVLRLCTGGGDVPDHAPDTTACDAVDTEQLRALADDLGAGKVADLIDAYLHEAEPEIAALADTADPPTDIDGTVARLHHLAGSSAMFGARALRAELSRLEKHGMAGDHETLRTGLPGLLPLWARTRAGLEAEQDGLRTT